LCQNAVPILVELLQSRRRIGDFLFVNHAIAIGIKSQEKGTGRWRMMMVSRSWAARSAILRWRRLLGGRSIASVLCCNGES
jgi:hypothetical protein